MSTQIEAAPIIGEIGVIGKARCQWVACAVCGRERWVRLERGILRSQSCRCHDTPETKERKRQSSLGHICSQETRSKISKARMGHPGYMLGKHHTEAAKEKIRQARLGKPVSVATREKLRQANLGKRLSEEVKEKLRKAHLGKVLTPEEKEKLRQVNFGYLVSMETRERLRQSHLGYKPSAETREKLSILTKSRMARPEQKEKALRALHSPLSRAKSAKARRGRIVHPKTRAKISASLMGHSFSDVTLAKMRRIQKRLWATAGHKLKVIKAMREGMRITPNGCERALLDLLNKLYPNEWQFVGDGSLIIAGKNPDFANVNGKKQLIEMFGDFWHKDDNPEERIAIFRPFGFKTLIVWERELKDLPTLTERVKEFVG